MKGRKLFIPFAAFVLALSMGLAACGNSNNEQSGGEQSGQPSESQQKQEKITVEAEGGKKSLILGQTVQLTAKVGEQVLEGVTWESAKTDIATVSSAGLVTSVSKGSATIKAIKEGYKDGSITISVDYETIKVTVAEGGKTSLLVGETVQLNADKQGVTWASSDDSIATVSNAGLVTAVKFGSATITASGTNLNPGSQTIEVVRPQPTATLHMEDAEHYAADGVWSSSNDPENSPVYNKSNASDGTCCAHFGGGDIETIRFSSSKAVKAEVVLMVGYYYAIDDLAAIYDVKFNGAVITMPAGQSYTPEDTSNYTYQECSFGELNLIADTNVLEIAMKEDASRLPYMDDLNIYAAEPVTITLVPAPQKDPVVINQESITVAEGKTFQITSSMTGLAYKSASASIASVDENGLVTGVSVGSTTIAISKEGYLTIRVPVTVTEAEGVVSVSIAGITGDGIATKESRNLTAPDNIIIDSFEVNAVGVLEFTVEAGGAYTMYMKARASGGYSASSSDNLESCMKFELNDQVITLSGEVAPSTFNTYLLGDVTLKTGTNTIKITCITSVPSINLFKFIPKA